MSEPGTPTLGPCCGCGRRDGVINVIMLPQLSPTPGKGWGCVVCGLPANGAVAVLCDDCVELPLKFVCTGHPDSDGRTPIEDISMTSFDHDMSKHVGEAL